jgi:hypothetical protein
VSLLTTLSSLSGDFCVKADTTFVRGVDSGFNEADAGRNSHSRKMD